MADDDDLPPPLEDMEEELALLGKLRQLKQATATTPSSSSSARTTTTKHTAKSSSGTPTNAATKSSTATARPTKATTSSNTSTTQRKQATKSKSSAKSGSSGGGGGGGFFGGFSKGFLSGGLGSDSKPAKKKTAQSRQKRATTAPKKKVEEIETIRPKASAKDTPVGVLPEVQESLREATPFLERTKDQWLNADLLKRFQSNPFLLQCLSDPSFVEALSDFQKDPAAAKKKYANNDKVLRFFKEYFKVMGAHFTELGDKEDQEKQQQQQQQQQQQGVDVKFPAPQ
ncbi:hypothetical protein PTSG_12893 [Salpingoeca rosetta]|uniref:Uncharacterized protein n=1 Tax=Salpingoeca rosetta (strain ATCC 50818 / BSB-021) TaxID=946362 RepID=F2UL45_SALR5|nr:uncharacterized protein PTSG_12893 [Salpingoeca rosetta]EGD77844.1 hypothetical protein PTSG_12893 [Salpingoeca rosetta]|eukprot:XP_004989908.1 hypothetical protein PTSG_12893 [Salpingoeca rosetta]